MLAISNVSVVSSDGVSEKQTILLEEDRIVRVADSPVQLPNEAQVVDGSGKFVMPGLWDMHTHLTLYGERCLERLLQYGVTTVRDMGGDLETIDRWITEIGSGMRVGPNIFRAGPFLDGPKKMRPDRAMATIIIETPEETEQIVKDLSGSVDFLKVHSRMSAPVFAELMKHAAEYQMPVAVHMPKDVDFLTASQSGAHSIEHAESLLGSALYEEPETAFLQAMAAALDHLDSPEGTDKIRLLSENGTWLVPTLVCWRASPLATQEGFESIGARLVKVTKACREAGTRLLAGTDFAWEGAGIRPGFHLHSELELLVEAGMTPSEALASATSEPAACMGIENRVGQIRQGHMADLVILDANPLIDISNTRRISVVIKSGVVIRPTVGESM